MTSEQKRKVRNISDSHLQQISVLKAMRIQTPVETEPKLLQIEEIAQAAGLNDEREIQRYLFILEGQKLVTPHPAGDFTSRTWQITKTGIRALRTIESSAMG